MAATNNLNQAMAPGKALFARFTTAARLPVWLRRALWAVGLVLLLGALSYAAVPAIVKAQIEKVASGKLGRQVTVGAVDFKPWSLELSINDLAIAGAGPSKPAQFSIKRLYINAGLESLLRAAPVVDDITLDQPALRLTHLGQGRYDIDDVLARLAPAANAPAGEPVRFALYNLMLTGGQLDFTDQPMGATHTLHDLKFAVPFLSNLQSKREVKTEPRLAFKLGGSSFDTAAIATPFAQTRKTDASFKLSGLDLSPYAAYLPASLPFKLQHAVLDIDAKIAFEQAPKVLVKLSGTVTAGKVRLLDSRPVQGQGGTPERALLVFDQLRITMEDVRPLDQFVKLSSVELTAPTLHLTRDQAGQLNILPLEASTPLNATKSIASQAASSRAKSPGDAQISTARSAIWKVQLARVAVREGRVVWLDETLPMPAPITLVGVTLNASALVLPFDAATPVRFDGALGLQAAETARLSFTGTATEQAAQLTATLAALPLKMAGKYIGQRLLPTLAGQLDAQLGVNWQAATGDQAAALRITAAQITLSDMLLAQGKVALLSSKRIELTGTDIDLPGKTFKATALQLTRPELRLERGANKRWAAERWLSDQTATTAPLKPPPAKTAGSANPPAWAVAIGEVGLDGGALSFSDQSGVKPVAFELSKVKVQLRSLVLGDKPASAPMPMPMPMPLSASLQLTSGRFEPGTVDFKGSVGLAPLQARGQLAIDKLPLQAFEPYFSDLLNIELQRADTSFKGQLAWTQMPDGPQVRVTGDAALEAFKASTPAAGEELLAWKALELRGLNIALTPAKATQIDVSQTVLSDFFARVIITPQGRINLQDLANPAQTATADSPAVSVASALPVFPVSPVSPVSAAPPAASVAAAALEPRINFGPVSLINGKVAFSDRFVKPNYSADLSELTGKLSAFSSVSTSATPTLAELELRGRVEGTASLEVLGKLNPLAKPLALNITGKVRDLELPPLSPYSVKYAGYGISRGKLSVDVTYLVLPDGQLTAKNKLILNQLSFGDKVEASAASLPVKLAVALLADRNGVIDIDLPISGSLNDPQFSLGSVIVKVIVNVIVKAITAPFSLLASALGGGDELSSIGFALGSAELLPDAEARLDKIAKALLERPTLQLTVVGTSDLGTEQAGLRRELLGELLRAEKRRSSVTASGSTATDMSVSPAEVPVLLKALYQRTDMPKPRQGLGVASIARDLPAAEMEALLLAKLQVGEDAMRALALQRGVAVKNYLVSRSLPPERLFLGAAKTAPPDAAWAPRAELSLALP